MKIHQRTKNPLVNLFICIFAGLLRESESVIISKPFSASERSQKKSKFILLLT